MFWSVIELCDEDFEVFSAFPLATFVEGLMQSMLKLSHSHPPGKTAVCKYMLVPELEGVVTVNGPTWLQALRAPAATFQKYERGRLAPVELLSLIYAGHLPQGPLLINLGQCHSYDIALQ